ncbi:hypothetical protein ACH5RR_010211 [Cinchona calisaya]|uniref:Uncharacterized protein n=1 Tax=Cinchona calisaya TaxID=153742 RepID=A0ABD3AGV1_9GENT
MWPCVFVLKDSSDIMKLITRFLQAAVSTFSSFPGTGNGRNCNSVESAYDFERRIFGDINGNNERSM